MATLYESYDSGINSAQRIPLWHINDAIAQTFTPQTTHVISQIRLRLYRVGLPGIININVYAVDVNHFPTGLSLASGTMDGDLLPEEFDPSVWRVFYLSSMTLLTAGIEYVMVLTAPNGTPAVDRVAWRLDNYDATYSRGLALKYVTVIPGDPTGQAWTIFLPDEDSDFAFREYGADAPGKAQNPTPIDGEIDVIADLAKLEWESP